MGENLVDTRRVRERRELRFASTAELLHDIDALLRAEASGRLRRTGNWTLGQALAHLAAWATYPFEGYPAGATPVWPIRLIGRLAKRRVLAKAFPVGVKIPAAPGGTWGADEVSAPEGAARCRSAFERLEHEAPREPNPVFGPLSHEQWKRLNLSHAELHLSFFHAGGA